MELPIQKTMKILRCTALIRNLNSSAESCCVKISKFGVDEHFSTKKFFKSAVSANFSVHQNVRTNLVLQLWRVSQQPFNPQRFFFLDNVCGFSNIFNLRSNKYHVFVKFFLPKWELMYENIINTFATERRRWEGWRSKKLPH